MSRPPLTSDQGRHILERIRKIRPFLQGSLSITKKRCGNLTCRCVKEGPIHEAALLTWKEGQKTRTLYVPIELRQEVAAWVEAIAIRWPGTCPSSWAARSLPSCAGADTVRIPTRLRPTAHGYSGAPRNRCPFSVLLSRSRVPRRSLVRRRVGSPRPN